MGNIVIEFGLLVGILKFKKQFVYLLYLPDFCITVLFILRLSKIYYVLEIPVHICKIFQSTCSITTRLASDTGVSHVQINPLHCAPH